jgi:hypothetical protein
MVKKKNKKRKKISKNQWMYIGIAVVIVVVIYLVYGSNWKTGTQDSGVDGVDAFAQCLTEKEVKMYGTEWCGFCKRQKEAFGDSFQYVDYIDCDQNRDICASEGVGGYPTWKIDGESYPGLKELAVLSQLSGCEL